ncbi:Protein SRG1 [Hordeum vulgare]|uniref:Fe2OG dioxygenase domain-containing protein n=2 Tax=Hordeum vulgare subsp. vulgare TaxID=112509 RepID=A0A8I6Z6X9_HORVV|nr:Protein SRG1 [Hordeum vulgare]
MEYSQKFKILDIPPVVQELVAGGVHEPPVQYKVPEQDRPAAVSEMPEPIPVIDLGRLSANNAEEFAKLQSALENWGFFLAVGHGMEPSFLAETMSVSKEFFKLPLEEKQKVSKIAYGDTLSIEGDILSEYTVKCRAVANIVLQNMAKLLNLDEEYFTNKFADTSYTLVGFNYYPPCPKPDHVFGLRPHTDGSAITVNFIDADVSGLQFEKNSTWYNVPIVPTALVVNIGDVMEILSNGFFKSLMHRVVTNTEKERLSLAMFYSLDMEMDIEPVPDLLDDKRPPRYKIKNKDYIAKQTYIFATGKQTIDTLKI